MSKERWISLGSSLVSHKRQWSQQAARGDEGRESINTKTRRYKVENNIWKYKATRVNSNTWKNRIYKFKDKDEEIET